MFRERVQALRNIDDSSNSNTKLEDKGMETNTFESFLDNKIVNMYARPWNKLETRLKLIKVKEYYNWLCEEGEISKSELESKIKNVQGMVKYNRLKTNLIKYDQEECKILEITLK
tara:strand:- start:68 stop:412 length:345 start_codon:yes stop_codon:yes gene_type:complete